MARFARYLRPGLPRDSGKDTSVIQPVWHYSFILSNLKPKIINALKWSTLSEVVARVATPIFFLVLAKILTPEDYGVAAIATIVVSLAQVVGEAGMGKALIQRKGDIAAASDVAFWSNLLLGSILYLGIFAFSSYFAVFFKDSRVTNVLRVQGLQIVIATLSTVPMALCQRELNYKLLFWVRLITTVVPGAVAIFLALRGFDYWSLVVSSLTSSALQCLALFGLVAWRPSLSFDYQIGRQLLVYSKWVLGEGLLTWFYIWADSAIIAYFLSSHELGVYRTGSLFISTAYAIIFSPIIAVLFSGLARLQDETSQFNKYFLYCSKFIVIVCLPVAMIFFCVPELFASLLFGDKWTGIEYVIMVIGLAQGLSWTISSHSEAFRAVGRPDVSSKIMGLCFLYYLPAYIVSSQYGLEAFLWTKLFLALTTLPIYFITTNKFLKINMISFFSDIKYVVVGASVMGVVMWFVKTNIFLNKTLIHYALTIFAGLLVYFMFLLPHKQFILGIYRSVFNRQTPVEV